MTMADVQISATSQRPALDRVDHALGSTVVWRTVILLVATLQLTLIFTHYPWVDEWQALQIALQTPTLSSLMENLRYEGHPPLWYLLLRGAAWVVPTYRILPVVAAVLAAVCQAIVLTQAPFRRFERLALAMGVVMMFEFLTISRGTTLGVALVLVAMATMRSRWVWVAIALLPLVDLLFGVMSLVLIALLARDRRLWLPGLSGWVACGLIAAWSIILAPDFVPALLVKNIGDDAWQWLDRLGIMLIPFQTVENRIMWDGVLPLNLGAICGPMFIWFAYRQTQHDRWHMVIYGGLLLFTLVFSVMVYPLRVRHLTVLVLALYVLKWRDAESGRASDFGFQVWLCVGALCGLTVAAVNFNRPFDQAHLVAKYITDHRLRDKNWLVYPENRAQGISALTGMTFERAGQNCSQTMIRWNARTDFHDWGEVEGYLRTAAARRGKFYLLSDIPTQDLPRDIVRQLVAFDGGYRGQKYYLSVVGPNRPEHHYALPPCVPGLRPLSQPTSWSGL
jgi:hypothetical protein